MGDVSSGCTFTELSPNSGVKTIIVKTAATVDSSDTIPIVLKNYGITTFLGLYGMTQTTADSVVIAEAPTTAVSSGTLTITVGGTLNTDKVRVYVVWGV